MALTEHAEPAGASPNPLSSTGRPRRRWPWVVTVFALLVLVAAALGWARSGNTELVSVREDQVSGLLVEVTYAPPVPATVTGARLETDAGADDDGGLYDPSVDDDVPPERVSARIGHPANLSFGFLPACDGKPVDDAGTITIQTSSGDRTSSIALPGLASKVAQWCEGGLAMNLSKARADAEGGDVEAVYRVVSPRNVVVTVASPGWRAEPLAVTAGEAADLTVSSVTGCTANPRRLALTATYPDGTEERVYTSAPGNEVCQS